MYLLSFWLQSEVEKVGDQSLLLSGGPKPCIFLHFQKHKTRWKAAIWFVKCILEFLRIRFDREASLVRSSWEAGEIAGGSMVLLLPWEAPGGLERDRGCDRRPSGDRRTGDQQWRARASLDPGLDVVEPRGPEPAGRTSKAMSTWTTLCLELPWKLKSAYSQSQKRRKLSEWQDFCRKNFSDKIRKLHHFSNSRQLRVKSVFANFKHNNGPNMLHRVHL